MGRKKTQIGTCIWSNCSSSPRAKFMCIKHYSRFSRGNAINSRSARDRRQPTVNGDITLIPLGVDAKDGYTIIDTKYSYLGEYLWHMDDKGYASGYINKKRIFLHRAIIGEIPNKMVIDHINRTPLDNRIENLRVVSVRDNVMNSFTAFKNTSEYKGVSLTKSKTFIANINFDYLYYYLGTYKSEEDAALAYDCAVLQLHNHGAYLNIIGKTYDN